MAEESLRPHDVMRMVNQGEVDRLLEGPAIWLCLTCETCTSRCPNGCDPAQVMDALRELAIQRNPTTAPKPIRAFHRAFLNQIKASGRIHEFGLVAAFKMTGGLPEQTHPERIRLRTRQANGRLRAISAGRAKHPGDRSRALHALRSPVQGQEGCLHEMPDGLHPGRHRF